jgi:NAD(P)-dependent dehydrogenase (short-subunit alcohol dehydrogenase family)
MTEPMLDDPKRASELLADIPAGRFGEPVEVAELVDFLLSGRATYLTGSVIAIDGARNV